MTDLHALISERCAEKIAAGKRPSRADLEWLDATREHTPSSSVEKTRNAKGDVQMAVKVAHADPFEAERINDEIFDRQRERYPMQNGAA